MYSTQWDAVPTNEHTQLLYRVQADCIRVFGKGNKERRVGISPELSTLLWKYIHKYRHPRKPDEPILFLATGRGNAGKPFGRGGMGALH